MYLISVYFDEKTNKTLQRLIDKIAEATGNDFMIAHQVPPHKINSEDYFFTAIKANESYTDFEVTTSNTELNLEDSMSVMVFYSYGGMYSIFSGEEVDNILVSNGGSITCYGL